MPIPIGTKVSYTSRSLKKQNKTLVNTGTIVSQNAGWYKIDTSPINHRANSLKILENDKKSPKKSPIPFKPTHTKISRNFRCLLENNDNENQTQQQILEHCCKKFHLKDIKLINKIGEGAFGKVYLCSASYKTNSGISHKSSDLNIAVKIIDIPARYNNKTKTNLIKEKQIVDQDREIEYSYYMGEVGLGPKIYHTFFTEDLTKSLKQYIIMEPFSFNAHDILKSNILDIEKSKLISEMISLMKKQIYDYNLFCMDTKPTNYVVNIDNETLDSSSKITEIRLIDFGDWCFLEQPFPKEESSYNPVIEHISTNERIDLFYLTQLIQLYINIYYYISNPNNETKVSNILNIFNNELIFKNRYQYKDKLKIVLGTSNNNNSTIGYMLYFYSNMIKKSKKDITIDDIFRLIK